MLARLGASRAASVRAAYATIEITDSVAQMGGHQVGLMRGYHGQLQQAMQALEDDVLNGLPRYHEMTAILDKVAAGELLARRQDMAANQLLSHALEQLLARSKRLRDTEAATMNMQLVDVARRTCSQTHACRDAATHCGHGASPSSTEEAMRTRKHPHRRDHARRWCSLLGRGHRRATAPWHERSSSSPIRPSRSRNAATAVAQEYIAETLQASSTASFAGWRSV